MDIEVGVGLQQVVERLQVSFDEVDSGIDIRGGCFRPRRADNDVEMCMASPPAVASALRHVQRLAFADAMIGIRVIAKSEMTASSRSGKSSSDASPRRESRGGGRERSGGVLARKAEAHQMRL